MTLQTEETHSVVAIDGPAASGKSSVARNLARQLGFSYVNSGSMYRAVAWLAYRRKIVPLDSARILAELEKGAIEFGLSNHESTIRVDETNPEGHLKEEVVNRTVSTISSIQEIRDFLLDHLRHYASLDHIVMEGRDIGSVVFPSTPYKFYVDASPEVRAKRRDAQGFKDYLVTRDRADSSRRSAPLMKAADAIRIDTSDLSIEDVIRTILDHLRERGLKPASIAP